MPFLPTTKNSQTPFKIQCNCYLFLETVMKCLRDPSLPGDMCLTVSKMLADEVKLLGQSPR
jgi:hypothetical protein